MRATRIATTAAAAALGAVALTCAVAPAQAADGNQGAKKEGSAGFSVTPSTIAAGGKVTLAAPGCTGPATVTAGVFNTVVLQPGKTQQATVDWDAKPGAMYDVAFTCNGTKGSASLTVVGGAQPTTSSTSLPSRTTSAAPVTSASPARGVRGGLGGSIGGMDTTQVAGGAALVVLAVGGTFYAVHRRAAGTRRH
ncbi:hypothetical protein GCM10010329_57050 [Streptomyces spiroverticillatus]|uniref:Lipoprotein n=1 Tax=Streptomyces finlayi TaxID=67296 RepID=A0A918X3E1_9ACTN|nr:hypothetical protein [Streptomyces finlayi]GHA26433.1 hypothetical protein GCM10010329_57050 [Streptomyces spiroverticillatus]GHD07943.1 hypothetical protein GCM10010334_60720 [Streptomyces finlayi]